MISERKIDDSFPIGYFLIDGFCVSYRLHQKKKIAKKNNLEL